MPEKMKAMILEEFGGAGKLKLSEIDIPKPADNELQMEVVYTAVNPVDWKVREGMLKGRLPHEFPLIPGWDAAGRVSAVGSHVRNFKVGDEIYAYCRKQIVQWGTYAEYLCLPENQAAKKPKNINFAQAAAIPLAGLTAWQSLFDAAKLKQGETVLILNGSGGVGSLAVQFANCAGAKVFATSSEKNHAYLRDLGVHKPFDYHVENLAEHIKKEAPDGVDVLLDCVGGEDLTQGLSCVKKGGRVVGIVEQISPQIAQQYHVSFHYVFVQPSGEQLQEITRLIEEGKVIPPDIKEMKLAEAAKAQEENKQGHVKGKIVLKVT